MAKHGKKYRAAAQKVDPDKKYELKEAIGLAKDSNSEKFDESLDVAVRLSVDPRKADQNIRGSVVLPKGTGKKFRVLVFAKGCLLYTSPSPRDATLSRMPSSA